MSALRADDHSTIGAILGVLLMPAIFWKRARAMHCMLRDGLIVSKTDRMTVFLGGAGIGAGLGLSLHWIKNLTGERLPEGPFPRNPVQDTTPGDPSIGKVKS